MQRSTSLFSFQHQSLYEGVESAGRGEAVARSEGIEEIGELIGFPTEFGGRQTDRADGRTREEHHFLLNWPDGNGMEEISEMTLRFIPSLVTTRSMST